MHELAVSQSILEISLRHAKNNQAKRITDIHIVIGDWSSFINDSIQFYWDMISEGTIAKEAKLHFVRLATELSCLQCGKKYFPTAQVLICPDCGGSKIKIISGEEFFLDAIEIEK